MYSSIESYIKHHGWTKTARVDYIMNQIIDGKTYDEVLEIAVNQYNIFPNERQLKNVWNYVMKIRESIMWIPE